MCCSTFRLNGYVLVHSSIWSILSSTFEYVAYKAATLADPKRFGHAGLQSGPAPPNGALATIQ